MVIRLIVCFLVFFSANLLAEKISPYIIKVNALHDKLNFFSIKESGEKGFKYFKLNKVFDSKFIKRDEWEIILRNPRGNSIKHKDLTIEMEFSGSRIFFTAPRKSHVSLEIKSICEPISEIIYKKINNNLKKTIEATKQSTVKISLAKLYSSLKKDELESYLEKLPDTDLNNSVSICSDTYNLLQYLRNGEHYGFETESYKLPKEIKSYLSSVAKIINTYEKQYELKSLDVLVTGYTDGRKVHEPYNSVEAPLVVYYDSKNCKSENTKKPKFIKEGDFLYTEIVEITDNCQLSATRAKAALEILKAEVKVKNSNFYYAAGGAKDNQHKDNAKHRSILIQLKLNAGN